MTETDVRRVLETIDRMPTPLGPMWLILAFVPFLAGTAEAADLMGSWQCRGPDGEVSVVFETGNRLVFGGEPSTYTLVTGAVRITDDGEPADYRYTLKGDSLSFVSPENERYQCKRAGRAAAGESAGEFNDMLWKDSHSVGFPERRIGRICAWWRITEWNRSRRRPSPGSSQQVKTPTIPPSADIAYGEPEIRTMISFRRNGGIVQGGLYWAERNGGAGIRPSRASRDRSSTLFRSIVSGSVQPP